MTTIYKKPVVAPYQALRKQAYDVQGDEHPARREIKKLIGSYDLVATIEEDLSTLALFKNVPGMVAFLCTLTRGNGEILAQGRGTAAFNRNNKYVNRTIHAAFNAAIVDAIVRAKLLDMLSEESAAEDMFSEETEPITDRQKSYLLELIRMKIDDEDEREELTSQLEGLSKSEASVAIESLTKK